MPVHVPYLLHACGAPICESLVSILSPLCLSAPLVAIMACDLTPQIVQTSIVHIHQDPNRGGSFVNHVFVLRHGVISPILPECGVASSPGVAPEV